jgi:hypothetical protein
MPIRRFHPVVSRAGDVVANRVEVRADRVARSRLGPLGRLIGNATEAWNQTGSSMVEGVPPLNVPPPARPTGVSQDAGPLR